MASDQSGAVLVAAAAGCCGRPPGMGRGCKPEQLDLGTAAVCAVFRVIILYACILFVHSLLFFGRRYMRARAARRRTC